MNRSVKLFLIFILHFFSESNLFGSLHSLYVKTDGTLWGMGSNEFAQLGDGTTTDRNSSVQIDSNVSSITFASWPISGHSLYVKTDGTLWAMGRNHFAVLGNATGLDQNYSVQIESNVSSVSTSLGVTLYIKTDGTLWGMGYNNHGQLGDGSTTLRNSPVIIDSNVSSVTAGGGHSLYIKTDGTLWGMGLNGSGQLGDGTTTDRNSSVQVDSNVSSVTAGSGYSLYIKTDGTLWAMGSNLYGQLGDGTTTDRNSSVQIDSNVSSVTAAYSHSLYVKTDGTLWAMGYNNHGQLGDGTITDRNSSVQIDSNVNSVTGVGYHSLYIKTDGTLWGMGRNEYGQLGDGTTTDRNSPVQISTGVNKYQWHTGVNRILTVDGNVGGTVSGAGIYRFGEQANLLASPSSGYLFGGWTGGITSSQSSESITVTQSMEVNATFTQDLNDSDGDGLSNYQEIIILGTDPNDTDSDDDNFTDFQEFQFGIDPNYKNISFINYLNYRKNVARAEGNSTGQAWVQANLSKYNLYTESEINDSIDLARSSGMVEANATIQADLAKNGLSLVAYSQEIDHTKPYTNDWFYQPGMGWLWTDTGIFPYMYCVKNAGFEGNWLYFNQQGPNTNVYFYDYSIQAWITPYTQNNNLNPN